MKIFILILAFLCLVTSQVINTQRLVDLGFDVSRYNASTLEDAFLTTPQLATKYGYKVEIHSVTTRDGYILEMHRIQSRTPQQSRKAPIFLMHGLQATSEVWVVSGPKNSLAYLLADLGYDVWIGNSRGNRYSRKHILLNPDGNRLERTKYWAFSFHEIGIYDLPAMIDRVLQLTGHRKLHFIGVSQGSTCFWVMASQLPKYNNKIIVMHALAPVAYVTNVNNAIYALMAPLINDLQPARLIDAPLEIPANSDLLLKYGLNACLSQAGNDKYACADQVHLAKIGGYTSPDQINTIVPVAINHIVGGSSVKSFVHFGQLLLGGKFAKFDFGLLNIFRYLQLIPPEYRLRNISSLIAIYHAPGDDVATIKDVNTLTQLLPNVIKKYLVTDPKFNHSDFIFSPSVVELLYKELFANLQLAEQRV